MISLLNYKQFDLNNKIEIKNTVIDTIDFRYSIFKEPVSLDNCLISNLLIHSSFFTKGLHINNCIIKEKIQFEMGGHNSCPIVIQNSIFCDLFVFFDCIFDSQLIIKNNIFIKGSTLFNNSNTFAVEPDICENIGTMEIDSIE